MWPCCDDTSSEDDEHNTGNILLLLFADAFIAPALLACLSEVDELYTALGWTSSPLLSKTDIHLNLSHYHLTQALSPGSETQIDCYASSDMLVERPTPRQWSGTHTPNSSPCRQTVRFHCDNCSHCAFHHSHSVRFVRMQLQPTSHLYLSLLLSSDGCRTACSIAHTGGPCGALEQAPCRSSSLGGSTWRVPVSPRSASTHYIMLAASHFHCVCLTGIPWLSALHCLQQRQSGSSSTSSTQPWSLTLEPNSTTPSGSTPNPQQSLGVIVSTFTSGLARDVHTQTVPLCSALPLGPPSSPSTHNAATADASTQLSIPEFLQLCLTKHPFRRTATLQSREDLSDAHCSSDRGNPREVTFADAATQLSFAEFFERCILYKALPPRPQAT